MATTRKEFVSLYLETKGKDLKGNDLKDGELSKEIAVKQLTENLVSSLSKLYAQITLAREYGLFDDAYADKIIKSAKAEQTSKNRKMYFEKKMKEQINKALGIVEKEEENKDLFQPSIRLQYPVA